MSKKKDNITNEDVKKIIEIHKQLPEKDKTIFNVPVLLFLLSYGRKFFKTR